jgi:GntR family carbon starvation induced transcriptional regulator
MKRSVAADALDMSGAQAGTVAEAAYARLRKDIVWGKLAPGTPLKSDELRLAYGIGISPLREALSRLVSERLVTSIAQRGFRVAPLTAEDVIDVTETRLVIEKHALARSIQVGDLAWEREIVSAYHVLSRGPLPLGPEQEMEPWIHYHRQFHLALIGASGSRWQIDIASLLFDQAERYRAVRASRVPGRELKRNVASEHEEIYEATLARDTERALAALEHHYRTTAEHVLAALQHASRTRTKGAMSRTATRMT